MATIVQGANKLRELEDSFRPIVKKIFDSVPSTYSYGGVSYPLEIIIVSGRRSPEENDKLVSSVGASKNSKHLYGLAIDYKFNLNGGPFGFPGSYGSGFNRDATQKIPNTNIQISAHDVFAIVGGIAISNGCTWGGNFRRYDPIHFQSTSKNLPEGVTAGDDDNELIIYDNTYGSDVSTTYNIDAGESSKIASEDQGHSPNTNNTVLFIGYDLTLSDFSDIPFGSRPLIDILQSAHVDSNTISDLTKLNGVKGADAYAKYKSNPNISITEDNADLILKTQVSNLITFLKNMNGFDPSQYPKEISTAIVSYFFAKNMATVENTTQLNDMMQILSSSHDKASELARYIESKSNTLPADLKSRRLREAQLLRSYNPNKPSTDATALTSTSNQGDYGSESELLSLQLNNQLEEIKKLFNSRGSSNSEPASSEYDDTFNDIGQSTLDSIANIMQSQQVNTDMYFGYLEGEYTYRVKTKNFYSILARKFNSKISNIENMMQTEELLKNHKDYTFQKMYSMIPYSDNLAYTIKKNAVRRCEYRIRLLEMRIRNSESSLISLGAPSTNSFLDLGAFILTLPIKFGVNFATSMINDIKSVFTTLGVLREQLKLEQGNLSRLKKDMNRYAP